MSKERFEYHVNAGTDVECQALSRFAWISIVAVMLFCLSQFAYAQDRSKIRDLLNPGPSVRAARHTDVRLDSLHN